MDMYSRLQGPLEAGSNVHAPSRDMMSNVQILPGEYIQAGRQGSRRLGEVKPPTDLAPNSELLDSQSFRFVAGRYNSICNNWCAAPLQAQDVLGC